MAATGFIAHYSNSNPAPTIGMRLAQYQLGSPYLLTFTYQGQTYTTTVEDISYQIPNVGGDNLQTGTSYAIQLSDLGKVVAFTNAASVGATLTAGGSLTPGFWCAVMFTGAAGGTITPPGGVKINNGTAGAAVTVASGSGGLLYLAATNDWWFVEGGGGGSSFTAGGDLSGTSTSQEVIGILSKLIDGTAPTDGQILQYSSSTGKWEMVVDRPIFPVSAVTGLPGAGQLVCIYTAAASMIFPANFATPNSKGSCGVNPTATATYSIYKNGTLVGNVAISTAGVFTFTTVGGATVSLNAGDRLTIVAPGTQDATLSDVGITLVGTRTATVPVGAVPPIFSWAGTYSGTTTYQPYQVVYYSGNAYVCILTTTGNLPTNTTYWNLFAAAGTTTISAIQQESYIYALDAGSVNAFSVTLSPAPSVVDGSVVVFRAANATTGASTLTLPGDTGATGGTAQSIVKQGGTALVANDVKAKQVVIAVWDNAHTQWEAIGVGGGDTTAKYIVGDRPAPSDLTNALSWPGIYTHPDAPPASSNAMDDEFDAGSLNTGLWTWVNQGGATATLTDSILGLNAPTNSGDSIRMIVQPTPATPWEVTAKIELLYPPVSTAAVAAIALYDSSGGKIILWSVAYNAGYLLANYRYTNTTTFSATGNSWSWPGLTSLYLRVRDNGTNVLMSISVDGCHWLQMVSESRTVFLPSGANRVGLAMDLNGTTFAATLCCDWFRRTL